MIQFAILFAIATLSNLSSGYRIVNDSLWEEMEHWAIYERVGRYLNLRQEVSVDNMGWLPNSNKIGLGYNPV